MEIYAELTRQTQRKLDEGNYVLVFPPNVDFRRERGSRALHIECYDEQTTDTVKDLLYESGISFQDND